MVVRYYMRSDISNRFIPVSLVSKELTVSRQVKQYCLVEDLNLLLTPLCLYYRRNISSRKSYRNDTYLLIVVSVSLSNNSMLQQAYMVDDSWKEHTIWAWLVITICNAVLFAVHNRKWHIMSRRQGWYNDIILTVIQGVVVVGSDRFSSTRHGWSNCRSLCEKFMFWLLCNCSGSQWEWLWRFFEGLRSIL